MENKDFLKETRTENELYKLGFEIGFADAKVDKLTKKYKKIEKERLIDPYASGYCDGYNQ